MSTGHVKERLSEYIDGLLPDEEKKLLEEHLASCKECAEALGELKRTVSMLRDLDEVEPPAWFTQKVMEKVREEAQAEKNLFKKLLGPVRSFVPLEAVGAIAIAITVIVLFKGILPLIENTHKKTSPEMSVMELQDQIDQMKKESANMKQPVPEEKPSVRAPVVPFASAPAQKPETKKKITPRSPARSMKAENAPAGETEGGKGFAASPMITDKIGGMEDSASLGGRLKKEQIAETAVEMEADTASRPSSAEAPAPESVEEASKAVVPVQRTMKKSEQKKDSASAPETTEPAQPMRERRALAMDEEKDGHSFESTPPSLYKRRLAEQEKRLVRIHLNVISVDTVVQEITEIVHLAGGKVVKTEPEGDKMIVSLTIPDDKLHLLIEKLDMMGTILKKKMPSVAIEGSVDVRIEIRGKTTQ